MTHQIVLCTFQIDLKKAQGIAPEDKGGEFVFSIFLFVHPCQKMLQIFPPSSPTFTYFNLFIYHFMHIQMYYSNLVCKLMKKSSPGLQEHVMFVPGGTE